MDDWRDRGGRIVLPAIMHHGSPVTNRHLRIEVPRGVLSPERPMGHPVAIMKSRRLSFLLKIALLIACLGIAPRGSALERWFYVSQNLWVDQNVTNLVALMQRASQAGYTHLLLNDSKFCRLATMDAHYFQNLGVIKQAATNLNLTGSEHLVGGLERPRLHPA